MPISSLAWTASVACSAGLNLREDAGLRVRLPLSRATIAGAGATTLGDLSSLVADELNVHRVDLVDDVFELRHIGSCVPAPRSSGLGWGAECAVGDRRGEGWGVDTG